MNLCNLKHSMPIWYIYKYESSCRICDTKKPLFSFVDGMIFFQWKIMIISVEDYEYHVFSVEDLFSVEDVC